MINKVFKGIHKYINDPVFRFVFNDQYLNKYQKMSDEDYLKKKFKILMGKELNLDNPTTFNEKLQWLKLHNRNPLYTKLVDKYEVRDYIKNKIGEEYLIPLIGYFDRVNDIDFNKLPNQFVLKCNHNSGKGMIICKDKSKLNVKKAKKDLKRGLKQDYFLYGREWPYKNVKRKVICEQYMSDGGNKKDLTDYKFYCFNGHAECVMACIDRQIKPVKYYFFDKNWNLKRINYWSSVASQTFSLKKPKCLDEMFDIAETLSIGMPFVRVDLYECSGKVYFGELTFFSDSGFDKDILPTTDEYFGKLIDLNLVNRKIIS